MGAVTHYFEIHYNLQCDYLLHLSCYFAKLRLMALKNVVLNNTMTNNFSKASG